MIKFNFWPLHFKEVVSLGIIFLISFSTLSVKAQIPNSDFEMWDTIGVNHNPTGWNLDGSVFPIWCVHDDAYAYSGNYALDLNCSDVYWISVTSKFPISYHPQVLHGFFRGNPDLTDTFFVKVTLFYFNQIVDTGFWHYQGSTLLSYTPLDVTLSQNSMVCDSAQIELRFTKHNPSFSTNRITVDHLFFDDFNAAFSLPQKGALQLNSNLSNTTVNLTHIPEGRTSFQLMIMNEAGHRYVFTNLDSQSLSEINISFLPCGFYEMILQDRSNCWTAKFVKQ